MKHKLIAINTSASQYKTPKFRCRSGISGKITYNIHVLHNCVKLSCGQKIHVSIKITQHM